MNIPKKLKFLVFATYVLCSLLAGQARAVPITVTTKGTISSGTDVAGTFSNGATFTNLTGDFYTQSVTLDPTLLPNQQDYGFGIFANGLISTGAETDTITINGVSKIVELDLSRYNSESITLLSFLSLYGAGVDEALLTQSATTTDGSAIDSEQDLYSEVNAFGIAASFAQNWSYKLQPGDVEYDEFSILAATGNDADANFVGNMTSMSISVPEPGSLALVALGLMALILVAMLRKAQS